MATTTKLTYFNGRGKAEMIRLTLVYLEIEFCEEYLTEKSQIEQLRSDGKLLFQQVPMLDIDGKILVQTGAILRYLARRGGIYGNNNEESSRIDELFEGTRDFAGVFILLVFNNEEEVLKSATTKTLPRYLPIFNKVLKDTGSGYLVGNSITLADLGLLEALLFIVEYFGTKSFEDYSFLQKFFKDMTEHTKIATFLNGPHRKPKNNQTYVDVVRKVLY